MIVPGKLSHEWECKTGQVFVDTMCMDLHVGRKFIKVDPFVLLHGGGVIDANLLIGVNGHHH